MSRWLLATLVAVLSLSITAPAVAVHGTTTDPVRAAAGWLAGELVDGERIVNEQFGFDDAGLTADVVFALASAGVAADTIASATDWLESTAADYTGPATDSVFAGASAKLALVVHVTGRDAREVGGLDLVAQLLDREQADGRFTDDSEFGDFSSTLTQALTVLALTRIDGVEPSQAAIDFLLDQRCEDGGFRFDPDAEDCTSAVDTTGFAVQALSALGGETATATISDAADWLEGVQTDTGGFTDGTAGDEPPPANANSTGLAAVALAIAQRPDAVAGARDLLISLQEGCEGADPGSIRFDEFDGGDRDRATTQAILGLTGIGLDTVSAEGASVTVPVFDCDGEPAGCQLPFDDVDPDNVHAAAICALTEAGIISGVTADRFAPELDLTRAQAASLLARALNLRDVAPPFADVDPEGVHAGAIGAVVDAGIAAGTSATTFDPAGVLRRDQLATLLANLAELDPVTGSVFEDVPEANVHRERINAVAEAGITTGVTPTTFAPARSVTRAQMASFLSRTLEQLEQVS